MKNNDLYAECVNHINDFKYWKSYSRYSFRYKISWIDLVDTVEPIEKEYGDRFLFLKQHFLWWGRVRIVDRCYEYMLRVEQDAC